MNHPGNFSIKSLAGFAALLFSAAFLASQPTWAQQHYPRLTVPYSKAALLSLVAIESDTSTLQDRIGETTDATAAERKIEATGAQATTEQEESTTEILRTIYGLKLQDNDLLKAYQKLIEIEASEDASDQQATKIRKDDAVSQLTDNEAAIEKREQDCFGQLEDSLRQRSPQTITACSAWIEKAKAPSRTAPVKSAASNEGNRGKA